MQSARSVWRQRAFPGVRESGRRVAICTERVEAKIRATASSLQPLSCNLHGACGGKGAVWSPTPMWMCCNLHGACGGKGVLPRETLRAGIALELQSARSVWRQSGTGTGSQISRGLQSARSVWRQRGRAFCRRRRNRVAICTERVEAKPDDCNSCAVGNVAICTERVEAKYFSDVGAETLTTLQSARSVWRQSLQQYRTMRVGGSCNLHGACGGKVLCVPAS